ncbi:DUF4263 domain-containing protein [Streptomyces sp. ATE26]|uniref:Shedu anti-phage system protein SduA domain-containing protein n=1 Tax=Streptomyces sp. ATE26 TaxID=2954237 RepID=UPI0024830E49|nr:Shedu anti-phage system protein SduA domain-containing protein [Streptomyces sp. ATE26]MDI1458714.1 DUF4263 domain-containing protein [Streptomyces sp. ATE26]
MHTPKQEDEDQVNADIARDPIAEESVGIEIINGRIRLVSIQVDGTVNLLTNSKDLHNLLYVASMEAAGWRGLVAELEELINNPKAKEIHFQEFFERNPEFLHGDTYQEARSHIILQREDDGPLIPDFALRPVNENDLCDLLEIKLPKAPLIRASKNRVRLTAAIMEACAQLREYASYFEDAKRREIVENNYGLRFFRPRQIVLIGERGKYAPNDLRNAESDVPNLSIWTYDDIVERARRRLRKR